MTHSIVGAAAWHTHPLGMERRLAAILSADVQGYSRLMHEDETATIRTLTTYRGLMGSLIQQYRGRVVDDPGDNLLAEFPSVVEAVQCAVTIQRTLATRNAVLPPHRQMVYRMGLHLGDIVVEQERIYGAAVNLAARLERVAEGGGLCISGTVYDHVVAKLPLDSIRDVPIKVYVFTSYHRYIVASEQGIWKKVVEKIWRKIRPSASRVTLSQPCRGYLQR
jgi:adenylate cyclase